MLAKSNILLGRTDSVPLKIIFNENEYCLKMEFLQTNVKKWMTNFHDWCAYALSYVRQPLPFHG